MTAWISSGSRRSLSVVEPTTSRNRMLTCLSVWPASASVGTASGCELGTQRAERGIDHRVAKERALAFERGDGGLELLLLGHDMRVSIATSGPATQTCLVARRFETRMQLRPTVAGEERVAARQLSARPSFLVWQSFAARASARTSSDS